LEIYVPPYYDDTKAQPTSDKGANTADKIFYTFNEKESKIIGKWNDSNDIILFIFKNASNKYFLTVINSISPKEREPFVTELVTKNIYGKKTFMIKKYLGDINPDTGQPWIDEEYTDYYQIDSNGDLIFADKHGIMKKYIKVD
jgi:hypothetical protein